MINITKTCNKCAKSKHLLAFPKNKTCSDGYAGTCKECGKITQRKWRENNKQHLKEEYQKWKKNNPEYDKEWRNKNIEQQRKYQSEYQKELRKSKPELNRWRCMLKHTLDKLKQSKMLDTKTSLGYSPQQLKEHLENQKINWGKHEIDHKIPVSWFKPETPPSIVNDLRNLQPLDYSKNRKKLNTRADIISEDYYKTIKQWILPEKINNIYYG